MGCRNFFSHITNKVQPKVKRIKRRKRKKQVFTEKKSKKKPYRIILTYNNKQRQSLGAFKTVAEGLGELKMLSEESEKNTIIEKKVLTTNGLSELNTAVVLIKKREENDPIENRVRDEYGEFITHVSTNDKWLVIDKLPFKVEEDFWVYGYHPKYQRKTCQFIFDTFFVPMPKMENEFLSVKVYKNKIVLSTSIETNMVIAKTKSEAIRLYNTLKELCLKNKIIKRILFMGDYNSTKLAKEEVINEIKTLTNWNMKKITRNTTKP